MINNKVKDSFFTKASIKTALSKAQREALEKDAMALAELVYDIYQDEIANDKILDGQNNAEQYSSS